MKKIVLLGFLVALGMVGIGCTRGEVSDGSNGVGIGIGMGPNPGPWHPGYPGDNNPYPPNDNNPDYPNDPWPQDPNYPSDPYPPSQPTPPRRPVRPPGSHCDRLGCWDPNKPNFVTYATLKVANSKAADKLVSKYGIPKSSALKIAAAFANVRAQGTDAYLAIGLTERDLKAMMSRQLPSDETVRRSAVQLGLSEKLSRHLLTGMMLSFFAQASNVNSPYWKYCQMGGHWKTDKNRSCSQLHWSGCSPQTGAKLCY